MLVLTRKQRQQIAIGDNITITVLRVKGSAVRIGIEAPDGVRILRAELESDTSAAKSPLAESTTSVSRTIQTSLNSRRSQTAVVRPSSESPTRTVTKQPLDAGAAGPLAALRAKQPTASLLSFR